VELTTRIAGIHSGDRTVQGDAFRSRLADSEGPVTWAYEVWDELVEALTHQDNRLRSIASQLLCNLAKSDPECRILDDLDALLAVTRDEKFVTARHCLLAFWKIGLVGEEQRRRVVAGLAGRFERPAGEKNGTLTRFDIVQGLRKLYDQTTDEAIRAKALELIETEPDPKYRKKGCGGVEDAGITRDRGPVRPGDSLPARIADAGSDDRARTRVHLIAGGSTRSAREESPPDAGSWRISHLLLLV